MLSLAIKTKHHYRGSQHANEAAFRRFPSIAEGAADWLNFSMRSGNRVGAFGEKGVE